MLAKKWDCIMSLKYMHKLALLSQNHLPSSPKTQAKYTQNTHITHILPHQTNYKTYC